MKIAEFPGRAAISRATKLIDGGRKRFLEYVQMAALDGDETAKRFWDVFSEFRPYEQRDVSFDDVCVIAEITPSELMGVVVRTGMEHEAEVGDLVAASMHPSLVHAAGKSGKRIAGAHADIAHRDRVAMLQHGRFLPIPKSATMHVEVNANASANAAAAAAASTDPSVPSFMGDMDSLQAPKDTIQKVLTGETVADAEVVED